PLFFLPITQEFFVTNKLYLLLLSTMLLFVVSLVQFFIEKKIVFSLKPLDGFVLLFLLAVALSTIISSPNKIQALLNPSFGLVSIAVLAIISYYLRRSHLVVFKLLSVSAVILAIISIVFFFQPLQKLNLPTQLQYLKNPNFNPLGLTLDLALFLGFFISAYFTQALLIKRHERSYSKQEFRDVLKITLIPFAFIAVALILAAISLYRGASNQLPPYRLSWYASVEILKNPLSALFGAGIDNFATVFTKVKDLLYNQSSLWQIHSFDVSHSALLHIFTTAGILGLISFLLLVISLLRESFLIEKFTLIPVTYLIVALIFFPPSLPLFFLFFIAFSMIDENPKKGGWNVFQINFARSDIPNWKAAYFSIIIVLAASILIFFYLASRAYLAEFYFKQAVDALATNDGRKLYDFQRRTILTNPFIERFRINFSQTNLLIANNVASRITKNNPDQQPSAQDRETMAQAIQAAILEAKAAVGLNEQKASNWENLGIVYRNLMNLAQGADTWAISAYQRAIINAHYNLAWALYSKGDYQRAYREMQTALTNLDLQTDKADFERAKKDLAEFEKKLPQSETEATPEEELTPQKLSLPSPPAATLEPKLELPEEASPEAE
ncbi:O-antigen ligase family protein, partial [Candidatus Roizmanbacteria bacterium]|nr:O-antigen ligase family protein [Candidatus Roizmanbacteria bacterium]